MRFLVLVFLLLGWGWGSYGQLPYFNERYGNGGVQSALVAILPTDSGYVAVGEGLGLPDSNRWALMLRFLDPQGQQTRGRSFGQPGYWYFAPAFGGGLLRQRDGGYVMAGSVAITVPWRIDALQLAMLWRFTAQGDTLWTRTYADSSQSAVGYSVCPTGDGGFALVGTVFRDSTGLSGVQTIVIRTDSLGQELWRRQYGSGYHTTGYTIMATQDAGFLISGFSRAAPSAGGPRTAPYVLKLDSLGAVQWQRVFGNLAVRDGIGTARPTADGGYVVAATQSTGVINSFTQRRLTVFRLNAQGHTLWQRAIGPSRTDTELDVIHELPDGSLVAAGQQSDTTNSPTLSNGFPEGVVFKLCANGDSLWYRTYKKLTGGTSHNYLRDLQPTPDGGFVGAGFLFSIAPDTGSSDAWAFKIDSAGYLQAGGAPVTVMCQPLGGAPEVEPGEMGIRVFPNPSPDGRFTVRGFVAGATLTVTDALGRRVLTRVLADSAEATVDLSGQPPGVYGLRVGWGEGRRVTRAVVVGN